jgi:N6-adenosine-specific RNA methylase IME4
MAKFDIILVDPPWSYNRKSTGGTNKSSSSQQYETMTLEEINDLYDYVNSLMNENSVLFMWTTNSFLPDALHIMWDWGYEYKTTITWVKRNNGLGNWFRGKTEHLLMGVKGKVKPFRLQAPNVIISDKTLKHSQKPIESYELINRCAETMGEEVKILEMFARIDILGTVGLHPGWECIGKEITGNDIKTDLQNILDYIPRAGTEKI